MAKYILGSSIPVKNELVTNYVKNLTLHTVFQVTVVYILCNIQPQARTAHPYCSA